MQAHPASPGDTPCPARRHTLPRKETRPAAQGDTWRVRLSFNASAMTAPPADPKLLPVTVMTVNRAVMTVNISVNAPAAADAVLFKPLGRSALALACLTGRLRTV